MFCKVCNDTAKCLIFSDLLYCYCRKHIPSTIAGSCWICRTLKNKMIKGGCIEHTYKLSHGDIDELYICCSREHYNKVDEEVLKRIKN